MAPFEACLFLRYRACRRFRTAHASAACELCDVCRESHIDPVRLTTSFRIPKAQTTHPSKCLLSLAYLALSTLGLPLRNAIPVHNNCTPESPVRSITRYPRCLNRPNDSTRPQWPRRNINDRRGTLFFVDGPGKHNALWRRCRAFLQRD
jgi:hypothetical protein